MRDTYEDKSSFESNRYNILTRRNKMHSLYDSSKWENGTHRVKGEGRKPRNKNHRDDIS